jgi:hypothetical protein
MYQIEKDDSGTFVVVCRSQADLSALQKDHPEVKGKQVEEGRTLLGDPNWLGYAEFEEIPFNDGTATLICTLRQFGANIREEWWVKLRKEWAEDKAKQGRS